MTPLNKRKSVKIQSININHKRQRHKNTKSRDTIASKNRSLTFVVYISHAHVTLSSLVYSSAPVAVARGCNDANFIKFRIMHFCSYPHTWLVVAGHGSNFFIISPNWWSHYWVHLLLLLLLTADWPILIKFTQHT